MGRFYSWPFIITDVKHPLVGADSLAHHGLLVDVAGKRLIDTGTCRTYPLRAGPGITPISAVVAQHYAALLHEFPDVFKPELRQLPGFPSKHGVYHHINTTGPPTHAKFRRLLLQKLRDAKHAFENIEWMGICKKASSPWASPLHMVKIPDGTWRPRGDYRRLTSSQRQTTTLCQICKTSPVPFMGQNSLLRWTFSNHTFKFLCSQRTCLRPPS
ncbi:uncharacterized protein [Palaemon carinicauda]|uniref:uncharacterized protein n=1 Tax=Palaemon carinicauda TaxID=392227 RepID=UPI0035B62B1A